MNHVVPKIIGRMASLVPEVPNWRLYIHIFLAIIYTYISGN